MGEPRSPAVATVVAIIPLKAIATAKTRMSPALSPADRALLLRRTFARVVSACAGAAVVEEVLVVVGDGAGRSWAREEGATIVGEPAGGGLNAAIAAADRAAGSRPTIVVPADLPLVTSEDLVALAQAAPGPRAVVVAPTADGGTGGLLRTPGAVIPPAYGPGSAAAHRDVAVRAGVDVRVVHLPGLALDLDRPADIVAAGGWAAVTDVSGPGAPRGAGTLPADGPSPRSAPDAEPAGGRAGTLVHDPRRSSMPQGTIKSFDHGSRSGTLVLDDTTELAYDTATFEASGLMEFRIGQRVRFEVEGEGDQRRVVNLQLVSL